MNVATRLGIALALAASGQAVAETPNALDFRTVDKNHDGRISVAEARADPELLGKFDALDLNHDGFLTPAEFSRWSRAGKVEGAAPADPSTGPSGSSGAQHMPAN